MKAEEIIWEGQHDDYTARVDGYTLRAEKVGPHRWRYACRHDKSGWQQDSYSDDSHWGTVAEGAMRLAAEAMNSHKEKNG
jgi:hypothetical protein